MAEHILGSPGWLFTPEAKNELVAGSEQEFFDNPGLFKTIIENIQDGVSILGLDLNIRYMNASMRYIYAGVKDSIGKKCYEVYHSLSAPCKNCPSLHALKTGKPQTGTVRYERDGEDSNWHQIFAIPVTNYQNEIILLMEYVRDVTFQKNMMENLSELAQRFETLEYQNKLLADVLKQRKDSAAELEDTIASNVERFIKPSLEYLKKTARAEDVDMVNGLIEEIIYPITKKRDSAVAGLTPRELQVASLIKEGYSSKEIADKLCVTQKAVDYHRLNIRKKLKLGRGDNLRSYLETHL